MTETTALLLCLPHDVREAINKLVTEKHICNAYAERDVVMKLLEDALVANGVLEAK